jgi:hypothetical protein
MVRWGGEGGGLPVSYGGLGHVGPGSPIWASFGADLSGNVRICCFWFCCLVGARL